MTLSRRRYIKGRFMTVIDLSDGDLLTRDPIMYGLQPTIANKA